MPIQDWLMLTNVSTCVWLEKTDAKDFSFFMDQGNFLKVVDTLEKYQ